MPKLRCLSIRQPWPELILRGVKIVENRSWATDYRGLLGIHAGVSRATLDDFDDDELAELLPGWKPAARDFGAVIGVVELVDCCRYRSLPKELKGHDHANRSADNWCWVLRNPRRLVKPFKAVGNATFFYVNVPPRLMPDAATVSRVPEGNAMPRNRRNTEAGPARDVDKYTHPEATTPLKPDAGTAARFTKKKPPATYRYDSSLSPALEWDGQNAAREQGEQLIRAILDAENLEDAKTAAAKLKALGKPFLNWAGKAERLSFDVPTLPLFIHERLSTEGIIETLKGHKRDKQRTLFDLFNDPGHSVADQALKAYEHADRWANRMILGDSLVVMNSLLHYENLGGQVQMIYVDPPYGVKFGSNFQPFVRKRDVNHNDDKDLTREPEMVQAYRDTWSVGLHSYLTYLRDRLYLCRDLLTSSGSVFVQISDENLHHVREVMDEVFGAENFCGLITFATTTSQTSELLAATSDHLVWYARNRDRAKFNPLYVEKDFLEIVRTTYNKVELEDGTIRGMSTVELDDPSNIPSGAKILSLGDTTSRSGSDATRKPFEFEGKAYVPKSGGWKTHPEGLARLAVAKRLHAKGSNILYKRYYSDFPFTLLSLLWTDTQLGGFVKTEEKLYAVQTPVKVIQRCMLMTTEPGDLVVDPTCGSGTTAYVAERWGRRWITADVSRVPLALARQRLLTSTFDYFELRDPDRGPAGGFVFKRRQNRKGEEVGGVIPHVTLGSIANSEPPAEEVLVDRPEIVEKVTRVSGPFTFEAVMPTPADAATIAPAEPAAPDATFAERMLEVLRRSPVLRLGDNKTVTVGNVRPPARSQWLSAEGVLKNGEDRPVAFVFGPENGPVVERLVEDAGREAYQKGFAQLFVVGFAIQPAARQYVENSAAMGGVPMVYLQATPDLLMGDLLKNLRASQIFSVCGLPDMEVKRLKGKKEDGEQWQVALRGLDVFDPITMEVTNKRGDDVPAWFLDTDYNGRCFHVCQAFFPRTSAWDNLKKALKSSHDSAVWDHLAGTESAPFVAGEHRRIAVKVIDDRGNELLVVKQLEG